MFCGPLRLDRGELAVVPQVDVEVRVRHVALGVELDRAEDGVHRLAVLERRRDLLGVVRPGALDALDDRLDDRVAEQRKPSRLEILRSRISFAISIALRKASSVMAISSSRSGAPRECGQPTCAGRSGNA